MPLTIRRATPDDAPLLARLNAPVQQLHADANPERFKPADADMECMIADYTARLANPDWAIFIAEFDGQPAGSVVCSIRQRDDNPYTYPFKTLIVDQLGVNEAFRRQGIGQALMVQAEVLARDIGAGQVSLNVYLFNEGAIAFYRSLGFEITNVQMGKGINAGE